MNIKANKVYEEVDLLHFLYCAILGVLDNISEELLPPFSGWECLDQ
jgi:hypothetical protein